MQLNWMYMYTVIIIIMQGICKVVVVKYTPSNVNPSLAGDYI